MRWIVLLLVLGSCCRQPCDELEKPSPDCPYSLTVFVAAKRLDYTDFYRLCRCMQRDPTGRVGHAWIQLRGYKNGCPVNIVGGLSGEQGVIKPTYCDGIMDLVDAGDPNPAKYLWTCLGDGFFQQGSGGYVPTYAATFKLTEAQFNEIYRFVQNFDYCDYSLTGWQCASFAAHAAALAGHPVNCQVTVKIKPRLYFGGRKMTLWQDPQYSEITFPSPDVLEQNLP